jgi:hypothetical protein
MLAAGTGVGCGTGAAGVGVAAGFAVDGREVVPRRGDWAATAARAITLMKARATIFVLYMKESS